MSPSTPTRISSAKWRIFIGKKKKEENIMTEEKIKEIKDQVQTFIICMATVAVVFNLNSKISGKNTASAKPTTKIENVRDSVRTDSIPTADFVKFQVQQQKVR